VPLMVDCTARQALMLEMICPRPWDWSVPVNVSVSKTLKSSRLLTLAQHDNCRCLTAERHFVKMLDGNRIRRGLRKVQRPAKANRKSLGVSSEHCVAVLSPPPNAYQW
jgi:hypothetical protein